MDEASRQQAEKQRTLNWINEKWVGDKTCPICRTHNWTVESVIEMHPYRGGSFVVGGAGTYPAAQVICTNCGYTHLFNAVLSGIIVPSEYQDDNIG